MDDKGSCDDCNTGPDQRKLGPDPYLVALGMDLEGLEDSREYRQCKFRKGH